MEVRNIQTNNSYYRSGNNRLYEYTQPVDLKTALYDLYEGKNIYDGVPAEKKILKRFIKDLNKFPEILKSKIKGIVGYGSAAIAFETVDKGVLKITDGNHFPLNRPLQKFDAPIIKSGKSGKTHFYLEEKLYQHDMPEGFVDIVRENIKKAGFRESLFDNLGLHQIGLSSKGQVYLLDPECACYKTPIHAIVDKAKHILIKRR